MVPTGDTPEIIQQYYQYLLTFYINPVANNLGLNNTALTMVIGMVLFITVMIFLYFRRSRNEKPSILYPVETYNGYISESNGGVGLFLWVFFAFVVLWLVATTVSNLIYGQLY